MTLNDATPTPTPPTRPRRRAAAVAGVVGVAAVAGGGAWAWQVWNAQGAQPAEALPANTLAYLAVDLDPPGGQKVAAFTTLRRLPTLKEELGLGSKDDLRDSLVSEVTSDSGCDLDEDALLSWAGDRAALAVVPLDEPTVVAAVQVDDAAKARDRLDQIVRECGEGELGYVVGEKWAILAETTEIARQVAADAQGRTLAEDSDFRELTGAAGDAGVMTAFLAPESGKALLEAIDADPYVGFFVTPLLGTTDPISTIIGFASIAHAFGDLDADVDEDVLAGDLEGDLVDGMPEEFRPSPEEERLIERMDGMDELSAAEQEALMEEVDAFYEEKYGSFEEESEIVDEEDLEDYEDYEDYEDWVPELPADVRRTIEDFSGLGGSVRFDDASLEVEVVTDPAIGGMEGRYDGSRAVEAMAALPADTAIAFGGGMAEGWGTKAVVDTHSAFTLGFGEGSSEKEILDDFEETTGLTVTDLEALGGDAIAFAAKDGFEDVIDQLDPFSEEDTEDAPAPPVAARVTGDADAIEAALDKLRDQVGDRWFKSERDGDDAVVIGADASYLEELVDPERTLGDVDAFDKAMADADDAVVASYADVDAGDWLVALSEGDLTAGDAKPLDTLSLTVTKDGDLHRLLARVTFD